MAKKKTVDMINGPLLQNIFIFAIPLMASNLLQMCFNAADTIVVGKFAGQEALAAVGATGSIIFLISSLFNGLSMGTNVVIAKSIGSGEEKKISVAVHTSITMALICGSILMVLGIFASKFMLNLVSTPANIIDLSALYMHIYFVGSFFMMVYNFGSAILRSKGDTQRPFYFLTFSGILNVLLNLFFVIGLKISVAGVALATAISQATSAGLVIWALMKDQDATHLDVKKLGIDGKIVSEILRIGIPAGIQGMAFSISNVVVQSSINSFNSSTIVAGNSAAGNLENFVYIGMMAFTNATVTFTSQNIGAKRPEKIKKIMWTTMVLNACSAMLVGGIVRLFGTFFLGLYTNDPLVVETGLIRLTWVAMLLVLNGILDVFTSSLRGMGYSTLPMIMMLVGVCGTRLAWLLTVFPLHRSLSVIYMCFPISWTISSILCGVAWYFAHKKTVAELSAE